MHPAILLNKRHHRVVLPMYLTHKAAYKIHIPPPSTYERDWRFSKDIHKMGIFAFGCSLFDFKNPFVRVGDAPAKGASQDDYWWSKWNSGYPKPNWLQEWGSNSSTTYKSVSQGPFVLKAIADSSDPIQIWMKYSCHFQFGGEILQQETITDPAGPKQDWHAGGLIGTAKLNPIWGLPEPQHPKHPSKRHIKRLGSGGELSPKTWRRLTESTASDYTTISESDGPDADRLSPRRACPTERTGSKETSPTPSPPRHRVRGHCFDLFLGHLESQLGRGLTSAERRRATKSFRRARKSATEKTSTGAASPP